MALDKSFYLMLLTVHTHYFVEWPDMLMQYIIKSRDNDQVILKDHFSFFFMRLAISNVDAHLGMTRHH